MAAVAHLTQPAPAPVRGIDHVVVPVRSYLLARRFYAEALAPLGFALRLDWPDRLRAYFGLHDDRSALWVTERPGARVEVSLRAPDRDAVDAFYAAARAAGAVSLRKPDAYDELTPHTYGAAVADADGNVIEAIAR